MIWFSVIKLDHSENFNQNDVILPKHIASLWKAHFLPSKQWKYLGVTFQKYAAWLKYNKFLSISIFKFYFKLCGKGKNAFLSLKSNPYNQKTH